MKTGSRIRETLLSLTTSSTSLGAETCQALPGFHAFTGCDTVSSFAGHGKISSYKLMQKDVRYVETFSRLGEDWIVAKEVVDTLEEFVCRLYGSKDGIIYVNEWRYALFCAKKGLVESQNLPPCKNALLKHIDKANFQSRIWKLALEPTPIIPSPVGFGWSLTEDSLYEIEWMDCLPAPESILELMSCDCPKVCSAAKCPCILNGLKCTDMCKKRSCSNYEEPAVHSTLAIDTDSDDNDNDLP